MKKKFVIDSSVAVKWVNGQNEKYLDQADKILKDVEDKKAVLIMPELAKYEVGNALWKKGMQIQNTLGSIATYYSIPVQFVTQSQRQAEDTMRIAYDNKITYYDATIMALAKNEKAVLVTDNPKHQAREIVGLKVVSLKDY